jgi:hypothetical protein
LPDVKKFNGAPKPSKAVRLGIIGVGGCGTNTIKDLAQRLDPDENPNVRLCAANTDGPQLWDFFLSENADSRIKKWVAPRKYGQNQDLPPQLQVLQLGDSGAGAGGKPEVAHAAAEIRRDSIDEFLDDVDVVVIQCGLGGGTGTGATPVFVDLAKSKGKQPLVIATMPFQFEGKKRLDRANAAREQLLKMVPTISIFNDRLPNKKLTFEEAWKKVTECGLLPPLLFLRRLLQVVGTHVNRDLADYGSALGAGNYVLSISVEDLDPNADVKSTVARLLEANPYQDLSILQSADYIIPTYEGPWGVGEVWEINQYIADQVQTGTEDFEMNYFIGNTNGPKSVGMLIVAKAPPNQIPPITPVNEPPQGRTYADELQNHAVPSRGRMAWSS